MIGAVLFFREPMRWERWLAAGIGLAGVLIVVAPKLSGSGGVYNLVMLASAPVFAASFLLTKGLTRHETHRRDRGLAGDQRDAVQPAAGAAALAVRRARLQWCGFALCGLLGSAGHYCLTRSFRAADISATQSVKFLDLVWATTMGWLVFADVPSQSTLIGGAVICAATLWIARRESRLRRRRSSTPESRETCRVAGGAERSVTPPARSFDLCFARHPDSGARPRPTPCRSSAFARRSLSLAGARRVRSRWDKVGDTGPAPRSTSTRTRCGAAATRSARRARVALVQPDRGARQRRRQALPARAPGADLELPERRLRGRRRHALCRRARHRPGLELQVRRAVAAVHGSAGADDPRDDRSACLPAAAGREDRSPRPPRPTKVPLPIGRSSGTPMEAVADHRSRSRRTA